MWEVKTKMLRTDMGGKIDMMEDYGGSKVVESRTMGGIKTNHEGHDGGRRTWEC